MQSSLVCYHPLASKLRLLRDRRETTSQLLFRSTFALTDDGCKRRVHQQRWHPKQLAILGEPKCLHEPYAYER